MSHNKMIFPNMNEKKMEKIKEEYEYTGSEPNSRQKSLDKFNENKNNIRKKEIKKAIKQLLTAFSQSRAVLDQVVNLHFFRNSIHQPARDTWLPDH